jgi:hypothetical protein
MGLKALTQMRDATTHATLPPSLLKDSLSGNSRTAMVAAIGAGEDHYYNTVNTLKYADR